jgi:hypothetical protein
VSEEIKNTFMRRLPENPQQSGLSDMAKRADSGKSAQPATAQTMPPAYKAGAWSGSASTRNPEMQKILQM